jgi:hypothetical protein
MDMARKSPEEKRHHIIRVIDAWRNVARNEMFSSMSLAEFTAAVQPSLQTRAEIEDLQQRLKLARRTVSCWRICSQACRRR